MDDKEFNAWLAVHYPLTRALSGAEAYWIKSAWDEATRRADKRAREECCEIVRAEMIANECKLESDEAYNTALTHAEQAIRATIKESPE